MGNCNKAMEKKPHNKNEINEIVQDEASKNAD